MNIRVKVRLRGYSLFFKPIIKMYSPNNEVVKHPNYIAYAINSGMGCQLPRIDRKRSLNMHKLRFCAFDQDNSRDIRTNSLDMHEAKANLRIMMKRINNETIGIKSCLTSINSSDINIENSTDCPQIQTLSPNHQHYRIHKKADDTPHYIKKYKLKHKPILKPLQQEKNQSLPGENRVPIFSVKLLKAMAKNMDRSNCSSKQKSRVQTESVHQQSHNTHRELKPLNIKVGIISLTADTNKQSKKVSKRQILVRYNTDQHQSLQKLIQNEDPIQKILMDTSNDKSKYSSGNSMRGEYGISPWF